MSHKGTKKSVLFALVALLLVSLPLVASAQAGTGTQGTGAKATATEAAPTTNGITSPKEDAVLRGTAEVRGYANDPNFMKWQLDLLPNGDPNAAVFLTLGETAGAFTYALDTSKLPAGEHALRLRVVRNDSNYSEYLRRFMIGKEAASETKAGKAEETTKGETAAGVTATGATTSTTTSKTTTTKTTAAKTTTGKTGATTATTGVGVTSNGLAAPTRGETLTGNFVVRGYANDPNFMKWQLDLLPNGNSNSAVFLALGEKPGVFTYTLPTANLPAGEHALRLRVVRNDSNYSEYTTPFMIGKAGAGAKTSEEKSAAEKKDTTTTEKKEGEAATAGGTTTTSKTGATGGTTTATGTSKTGTTATGTSKTAGATSGKGVTENGLAAPTEGETIRGEFVVRGYANDPNFMKWQLDLLPNGDPSQAAFLATGDTPGKFTYTLDTRNLPAGKHALRLRVVRNDSNYSEYTTNFTLAR